MLTRACLVVGQTVNPRQSSVFGSYAPDDDTKVLALEDLDLYKEDWIGLRYPCPLLCYVCGGACACACVSVTDHHIGDHAGSWTRRAVCTASAFRATTGTTTVPATAWR
jgi:hypothetical protein